jgi:nicotinamide mononucleotide transporter
MDATIIWQHFIEGIKQTSLLEYLAVISGIVSVWYSRKANMLVYPTGLINTTIYVYLSIKASLPGEASVNAYFTIMSIYGWMMWKRKDQNNLPILQVSFSGMREWMLQLLFFGSCYGLIYWALTALQKNFAPGVIPWADALASASAYTGMWLMTRKKVESWIWWIITNTASIPLYFVKGYVFTSTYYIILLLMAISGLLEWRKKANLHRQTKSTFLN